MSSAFALPAELLSLRIGLIGYGEVGRILAEDFRAQGLQVCAYDSKLGTTANTQAMREHAQALSVVLLESHAEVCKQTDLLICAVTASQTLIAAKACAPHLLPQAFFLDVNSASPGTKQAAAAFIDGGAVTHGCVHHRELFLQLGSVEGGGRTRTRVALRIRKGILGLGGIDDGLVQLGQLLL